MLRAKVWDDVKLSHDLTFELEKSFLSKNGVNVVCSHFYTAEEQLLANDCAKIISSKVSITLTGIK